MIGIGGGWFAREHEAFGIDFGSSFGDRLDRLDEAVGLIRRLRLGDAVQLRLRDVETVAFPSPHHPPAEHPAVGPHGPLDVTVGPVVSIDEGEVLPIETTRIPPSG